MYHNDHYLLKDLRLGNKEAYQFLYEKFHADLVTYCYNLTDNLPHAKDIVQNVFIKIWERRESIIIHTVLKSYLYRCVFNEFATNLKKRKLEEKVLLEFKNSVLLNLVEQDNSIINRKIKQLEIAIDELPPKCKEVFLLNKKYGYRYKEIATQLNISEKTVEKHISRAFQRIKNSLNKKFLIMFLYFSKF